MSSPDLKVEMPEQERTTFSVEYDKNPVAPETTEELRIEDVERAVIQIDVRSLAIQPHGTVLLRGYLEERKVEILNVIAMIRKREAEKQKSRVLVPGSGAVH